jgi:hypothetical protein
MMVSIGFVTILTALMLVAALALTPGRSDETEVIPPDGALLVAQDGTGDYETIGDAVVGAVDGDVVFIEPGEYVVGIVTGKSLTFLGGAVDREDVVIRADPSAEQAFELQHATARFERLTFESPTTDAPASSPARGVLIVKGTVEFADVSFSGFEDACAIETSLVGDQLWAGVEHDIAVTVVGSSFTDGAAGICALPLDSLRVEGSTFRGLGTAIEVGGAVEVTNADFEDNEVALWAEGDLRVRDSRFVDNGQALITAGELDGEQSVIGNEFIDNATAMTVGFGGFDVRDNTISGGDKGIRVEGRVRGSVTGNVLRGIGGPAIEAVEARGTFAENDISGGGVGISVDGGVPDVLRNRIDGVAGVGISVTGDTGGSVVGNELCDNGADIDVAEEATTTVADNTVCDR